jgi:hypothetical protein
MFQGRLRATREYLARGAGTAAAGAMLVLLYGVGPAAEVARAEEEARPGWTVGLDGGFEVFEYDTTASVQSNVAPRQSGVNQRRIENADFKFGIGAMTPALDLWLSRARIFAAVGGQVPFASDEAVFDVGGFTDGQPEGEIEQFEELLALEVETRNCITNPNRPCPSANPEDFVGQGSEIGLDIRPYWYTSLGVTFDFDLPNDFLFRLMPSFEYAGSRLNMAGMLTSVMEPSPEKFTVIRSTASASVANHWIGPGIEGELVISRSARPVAISMYVDARFLYLVNDSTTSFTDSQGIAQYSVEVGNALSFGAGARVTWMAFGR